MVQFAVVNKESLDLVRKYLAEVSVQWKTGQATEHSYRPTLKTLLEGLLQKVIVINDPPPLSGGRLRGTWRCAAWRSRKG